VANGRSCLASACAARRLTQGKREGRGEGTFLDAAGAASWLANSRASTLASSSCSLRRRERERERKKEREEEESVIGQQPRAPIRSLHDGHPESHRECAERTRRNSAASLFSHFPGSIRLAFVARNEKISSRGMFRAIRKRN